MDPARGLPGQPEAASGVLYCIPQKMEPPTRTLILSDLHLGLPDVPCGRPIRTPESIEPLLEGIDRLVLNGDTADIHQPRYMELARKLLEQLTAMVARKGIQLVRISGNHDFDEANLSYLELGWGRIMVTHGHAFGKSMLPWTPAFDVIEKALSAARDRHPKSLEGALAAANEAAMAQWDHPATNREPTALVSIGTNPWRVYQVLKWWRTFPHEAAAFVRQFRPTCELVVCGHSHRSGDWSIELEKSSRCRILNTGSFSFPSTPRGVIIVEDSHCSQVEMRTIVAHKGRYAFAPGDSASRVRIQRPT